MNPGQVDSEVEVNAELMLKSTFKLGDHDPVDVGFVSAWISEIADVRNLKSLKNKAAAYAQKLVESECLETKQQMAEMEGELESWVRIGDLSPPPPPDSSRRLSSCSMVDTGWRAGPEVTPIRVRLVSVCPSSRVSRPGSRLSGKPNPPLLC